MIKWQQQKSVQKKINKMKIFCNHKKIMFIDNNIISFI